MVQNLLASVYRYYSVGLSQFSHVYPGASEIRKIVDAKINDVISGRAGEWEVGRLAVHK